MESMMVMVLLAVGLAIFFAWTTIAEKRRSASEEKVLKGYFLLGLSGLMAKIAMADGKVSGDEATLASGFFNTMELTDAERAMCLGNFITARRSDLTARDHAKRFLAYTKSYEAAAFLYDLLWRLSAADGKLDPAEDALLKEIAEDLGLDARLYERCKKGESARYDRDLLKACGVPASMLALA